MNCRRSGDYETATAEEIAAGDFVLTGVRFDDNQAIDDIAIAGMARWPLPSKLGLTGNVPAAPVDLPGGAGCSTRAFQHTLAMRGGSS